MNKAVYLARRCIVLPGNYGWGLLIASYGKMDDLSQGCCLTGLLGCCIVVLLQRVGERGIHRESGAGYAVTFRCPGAEVGHLTMLRTEGAPGIAFPGAGLVAEGADHAWHCTMVNARIGQRSTLGGVVSGRDVQQSLQAALIDLRETEKFDAELPASTPTNRGGLDGNGRTQIGRPDENSHR